MSVCVLMYELFSLFFFLPKHDICSVIWSDLCVSVRERELDSSVSLSFCVVTTLLSVKASVVWTDTGRSTCIWVCVNVNIHFSLQDYKLFIHLVPGQWRHFSWTLCTCNIFWVTFYPFCIKQANKSTLNILGLRA